MSNTSQENKREKEVFNIYDSYTTQQRIMEEKKINGKSV